MAEFKETSDTSEVSDGEAVAEQSTSAELEDANSSELDEYSGDVGDGEDAGDSDDTEVEDLEVEEPPENEAPLEDNTDGGQDDDGADEGVDGVDSADGDDGDDGQIEDSDGLDGSDGSDDEPEDDLDDSRGQELDDHSEDETGLTDNGEESGDVENPETSETPEEPETAEDGETPEELETAEDGETPEEPETAEDGETPEEPETTEEAEAPEEPETAEDGETPEEPETAEDGETPEEPETTEEAETPEEPEAPEKRTPEDNVVTEGEKGYVPPKDPEKSGERQPGFGVKMREGEESIHTDKEAKLTNKNVEKWSSTRPQTEIKDNKTELHPAYDVRERIESSGKYSPEYNALRHANAEGERAYNKSLERGETSEQAEQARNDAIRNTYINHRADHAYDNEMLKSGDVDKANAARNRERDVATGYASDVNNLKPGSEYYDNYDRLSKTDSTIQHAEKVDKPLNTLGTKGEEERSGIYASGETPTDPENDIDRRALPNSNKADQEYAVTFNEKGDNGKEAYAMHNTAGSQNHSRFDKDSVFYNEDQKLDGGGEQYVLSTGGTYDGSAVVTPISDKSGAAFDGNTDVSEKVDVSDESDTSDKPDTLEESNTPEQLEAQEKPEASEQLDVPEKNESPEQPDAPDKSEAPEELDTQKKSETSENAETGEEPVTSENAEVDEKPVTSENAENSANAEKPENAENSANAEKPESAEKSEGDGGSEDSDSSDDDGWDDAPAQSSGSSIEAAPSYDSAPAVSGDEGSGGSEVTVELPRASAGGGGTIDAPKRPDVGQKSEGGQRIEGGQRLEPGHGNEGNDKHNGERPEASDRSDGKQIIGEGETTDAINAPDSIMNIGDNLNGYELGSEPEDVEKPMGGTQPEGKISPEAGDNPEGGDSSESTQYATVTQNNGSSGEDNGTVPVNEQSTLRSLPLDIEDDPAILDGDVADPSNSMMSGNINETPLGGDIINELPENAKIVDSSSIDTSTSLGMDDENFWDHHGNTKEDYISLASKLPEIQERLNNGESLESLYNDPELGTAAWQYYSPKHMVRVEAHPDGTYELLGGGRHRVAAAQELGYEMPVKIVNYDPNSRLETAPSGGQNEASSLIDRYKDFVYGKESAYDAKRAEEAGIKGAFDELPRERREAVYEAFENAPESIKKIVNELSGELSVEKTRGDECCHYDLIDKRIRMEGHLDDGEYAEIFSHEYGHFVDDFKGKVSDTPEFREAIQKDLANFNRSTESGRVNFDNMLNDLMNSDAAWDRAVSDSLSAYFKNAPEIIQRYDDEGFSYYQHENSYWSYPGKCEAEIYANMFSMSAQGNKESCEFMAKYFPNTWAQFNNTLQGDY